MHVFDRQTDRQTEFPSMGDRILFAIPRLHSMQRGKKSLSQNILVSDYFNLLIEFPVLFV